MIYSPIVCRVTHTGRLGFLYKFNSGFFHEGNIGEETMKFGEDGDYATVNITNPWTTLPELKTARSNFPMAYLDDYLYVIGRYLWLHTKTPFTLY